MPYPTFMRWLTLAPVVVRASRSKLVVDRLLMDALALKSGRISDLRFETHLKRYFATCLGEFWNELALEQRRAELLSSSHPYKVALTCVGTGPPNRSSLWERRLGVVRGLGVRLDLLTLAAREEIEPHGHSEVVSGFLVLEGQVRGMTFDRLASRPSAWLVRRNFDQTMSRGAFLTSSEWSSNIHWLVGIAERSLLFRVTVSGFPTKRFDDRFATERVHVELSDNRERSEPVWARVTALTEEE